MKERCNHFPGQTQCLWCGEPMVKALHEALEELLEGSEWSMYELRDAEGNGFSLHTSALRLIRDALSEHVKPVVHGVTCKKAPHTREGYLHGSEDDTPYMVDGCEYCGRCHYAL